MYVGLFLMLIATLSFSTEDGSLKTDVTVPMEDGAFYFVTAHLLSLCVADMLMYIQLNFDDDSDDDISGINNGDHPDENTSRDHVRAGTTAAHDYQMIPGEDEGEVQAQGDGMNGARGPGNHLSSGGNNNEEEKEESAPKPSHTTAVDGETEGTSDMTADANANVTSRGSVTNNDLSTPLTEHSVEETGDDDANTETQSSDRNRLSALKTLCQECVSRGVFLNAILFVIVATGVTVLFAPIIRLEYYGFSVNSLDEEYISNEYTVFGIIDAIYDILRDEEGTLSAVLFFTFFLVDIILSTVIVLIIAVVLEHPRIVAHIPDESMLYIILLYTYPFMNIESFTVAFMLFATTAEDLGEWVLNDMIDICDQIDNNTPTECLKLKSTVLEGGGALLMFALSSVVYIRLVTIKTKVRMNNAANNDVAENNIS